MDSLWKKNVFGVCGARDVYRHVFHGVVMSSAPERDSWLNEVEQMMDNWFPKASEQAA
jgi:putative NADPH-quinone reductase